MSDNRLGVVPSSKISFRRLQVHREEGRPPLLGCVDSRRWLEVDEETLRVIDLLSKGETVESVERALTDANGETVDVVDLLGILVDRGFVQAIDDHDYGDEGKERGFRSFHKLNSIPPEALAWIRSPLLAIGLCAVVAGWIALLFVEPSMRPRFSDLAVHRHAAVSTLVTALGLFAFANLHEAAHFLVARSHGVESAANLSHRFYLITLQTDVTNAWHLPRKAQMQIFLAGLTFNISVAAAASVAAGLLQMNGGLEHQTWIAWLKWLAVVNLFPLPFQLLLFARTDLYYVLQLALRERNLARDSLAYMKLEIRRVIWSIRGAPYTPCPHGCGGRIRDQPFCFKCGRALELYHPNSEFALRPEQRWKLRIFGPIAIIGQTSGYLMVAFLLWRLQRGYVQGALRALWTMAWTRTFDVDVFVIALVMLIITGGQIVFAGFFFVRTLRGLPWDRLVSAFGRMVRPKPEFVEFRRLTEFSIVSVSDDGRRL